VRGLPSGRFVGVQGDVSLIDLTKPLPTGVDVMGQPTGPYKVKALGRSVFVSQGWPDANASPVPPDHAIVSFQDATMTPRIDSSDFWNPYDFEIVGRPSDGADLIA